MPDGHAEWEGVTSRSSNVWAGVPVPLLGELIQIYLSYLALWRNEV